MSGNPERAGCPLLALSGHRLVRCTCLLLGAKRTFLGIAATLRYAGFHQKHGHVSRMACITPVCALALQVLKMLVCPRAEGLNQHVI